MWTVSSIWAVLVLMSPEFCTNIWWGLFVRWFSGLLCMEGKMLRGLASREFCSKVGESILVILNLFLCMKITLPLSLFTVVWTLQWVCVCVTAPVWRSEGDLCFWYSPSMFVVRSDVFSAPYARWAFKVSFQRFSCGWLLSAHGSMHATGLWRFELRSSDLYSKWFMHRSISLAPQRTFLLSLYCCSYSARKADLAT